MTKPMKIRARSDGALTEVKVLMSHDMETGRRKNQDGDAIPAHFIQRVTVKHGARIVLSAQWGTAVSKNPFLFFKFGGGAKGEQISVTWIDNKGESRTDDALIM